MLSNNDGRAWVSRYRWAFTVGAFLFALVSIGAQPLPSPAVPQGPTQAQTSTAPAPAGELLPNQASPGQTQLPIQPVATPSKPLVMIDPAHGGSESGAVLNPTILEKDVTLAL